VFEEIWQHEIQLTRFLLKGSCVDYRKNRILLYCRAKHADFPELISGIILCINVLDDCKLGPTMTW
jgi:hypothetical protein